MVETSKKYRSFWICVLLVLATIIAYEPIRHNDFVDYDDHEYITENPHVTGGVTYESLVWAFTTSYSSNWHPLTWLSHMLDCELFGLNPFWHHLTNVAFHIANTLLLFWIMKKTTGMVWASFFVAAAFAIHPLHVESVAWTSERKDVLSGLFWMLTMAAYVRYAQRPSVGRYLAVVLALSVGLMAKPMLVTLPFVLILLDYWPLERLAFKQQSSGEASSESSESGSVCSTGALPLIIEKIPLFVLAVASGVITLVVQKTWGALKGTEDWPVISRVANGLVSYIAYIFKMIYPSDLAILYPLKRLPLWQPIASLLVLIFATVVVIYAGRRRRYLVVGWLWYLVTLVPVIGLVQVGSQAMADRYSYLPLVGIFAIVGLCAAELVAKWPRLKVVFGIATVAVLAVLMICTRTQIGYWRNSLTLYERSLAVTKNNYIIHNFMGNVLKSHGRLDEAISHYVQAIQIRPSFVKAYEGLGDALISQGKRDEALSYYRQALRVRPDSAEAHYNAALVLRSQNKLDEALSHFRQAVQLDPDLVEAQNNLACALTNRGRYDEAVRHFNEALRVKPDYTDAINNLAFALKRQGKINKALEKWKKVLELEPGHRYASFNIGLVMEGLGTYAEAIKHFNKALEAEPNWPEVHYRLARVYQRQGNRELAAKEYTEVLRLNPDYVYARLQLAYILAELGQTQAALDEYYKILLVKPEHVKALGGVAWTLATSPPQGLSAPNDAVKFAVRACELTGYNEPEYLDTLAAAYAAAGKFSEAIETATKAVKLAEAKGNKVLSGEIWHRLELYKAGQSYLDKRSGQDEVAPE